MIKPWAWSKSIQSMATAVALIAAFVVACAEKGPDEPVEVVDPCLTHPCTLDGVVTQLETAYATRDWTLIEGLLHAEYRFYLAPDPANSGQPTEWGRVEELRIHRRLFDPATIPPSEDPVPPEQWITAVTLDLTAIGPWQECGEFYESPTNPGGLDSTQVAVSCAEYNYSLVVETQGDTDYLMLGQVRFAVTQARDEQPGESGAITLYRCYDLSSLGGREGGSWTRIKLTYW